MKRKYPQEVRDFLKICPLKNKELQAEVLRRFGVEIELKTIASLQAWYQGRRKQSPVSYLTKPLGTERLDKDGYIRVRVEGGERVKHRLVWELNYGEVKPTEVIMFKDGDRTNCNIENLIKTKRKYLSQINRIMQGKPREFLETAISLAELQIETKDKKFLLNKNKPQCQPRKDVWFKVVELWNEGLCPAEISKKLNRHVHSVRWMLRKYRAVNELENVR